MSGTSCGRARTSATGSLRTSGASVRRCKNGSRRAYAVRDHGGMVFVREISADDWELMREVRLAALSDAPDAFGSSYAREAAFGEPQWRGRISDRSVTFFGYADPAEPPAGLAGVYVEDGMADLVSMWVRPVSRGLGVGEALVEAAAFWAKEHGFGSLS